MKIIEPKIWVEAYDPVKIMRNLERACRTCYRSEDLITEDSYKRLLKNCINRGHESILEHEKITVRMVCDVGVYKDLTRHRFGSFSIESTRYCNYGKDKFENEIKFIKPVFYIDSWMGKNDDLTKEECISLHWYETMSHIEEAYMLMSEDGAAPDQMRMILPHSTAAEVTMTANIREWRHILDLRTKKMTHPAIRQLLIPLLLKFQYTMPELFGEIEYDKDFPIDKYAELGIIE